jgi:hypothetical protein
MTFYVYISFAEMSMFFRRLYKNLETEVGSYEFLKEDPQHDLGGVYERNN